MQTNFDTHILNHDLKRFEPKDTTCRFCKKDYSVDMEDNYFVPVYREQNRLNVVVFRSVKFNKVDIGISRCEKCKSIHENSNGHAWIYALLLVILVVYFSFHLSIWLGIILLLISVGGVFLIKEEFEKMMVEKAKILTVKKAAEADMLVVEFILNGWTLNKPMA